jgi:hypothetical protein
MKSDQNPYETTHELYYAAYLMASGCKYVRVDRSPGTYGRRRCFFVFDPGALSIEALRAAWINKDGNVNVRNYVDAVLNLKSLVHSVQ